MGHAQRARIVVQHVAHLDGVRLAVPDGGAAGACARGVATLHHKAFHHPVKGHAVVIALLRKAQKVLHGHGGILRVDHGADIAEVGADGDDGVAFFGRLELQLVRAHSVAHFFRKQAAAAFAAAGTQAQQNGNGKAAA